MPDDHFFYPPPAALYPTTAAAYIPPDALPTPPAPAGRRLTILPELQVVFIQGQSEGFRLRMTAINPVNVDPAIFVYLAAPLVAGAQTRAATFQRVASPTDLAEIPTGQPADGATPPWLRLDYVELDFWTRAEAVYYRDAIAADASSLLESLRAMDTLSAGEPILITET